MFRAAYRSTPGAPNCICNLWFIYPCGDRPLSRLGGNCSSSSHRLSWVRKESHAFCTICRPIFFISNLFSRGMAARHEKRLDLILLQVALFWLFTYTIWCSQTSSVKERACSEISGLFRTSCQNHLRGAEFCVLCPVTLL